MNFKSGKIWPYAIAGSIIMVFGFCVATVYVAQQRPVEKSDTYMMGYHQADANANALIMSRINFDKKYKVEYITDGLSLDKSVLKYKVTDLDGESVNDVKIKVVITRPNHHRHDQELLNPHAKDGIYTFDSVTLPVEGRWDIMAQISIGDDRRYLNMKADTRAKEAFEY